MPAKTNFPCYRPPPRLLLLLSFCSNCLLLVLISPEGGWAEPDELDMFANMRFQEVTLGTRVLRSDVAVVSLLALAHEICAGGQTR